MSVDAHYQPTQQSRSLAERLPFLLVIALCVGIDLVGVWYIVQIWDRVLPYLPWLLLAIAVLSFGARVRKVLRNEDD